MTTKSWILTLKQQGILTEGIKNGQQYYHLKTPCKIILTDVVTKQLKDKYDPKFEKGGILVATPTKIENETILTIQKILFLKNVSKKPASSYRPDNSELESALKQTLEATDNKTFPIRFHTHPTHSDNPPYEFFNYIYQSNTSEQDQIVSDTPYPVQNTNIDLLLPRSLILCSNEFANTMFIGFYNGLISPIEFGTYRQQELQKSIDEILDQISEWAKKDNNILILFGGAIVLAVLIIKFNRFAIPLILLLVAMMPTFVNLQYDKPKYYAQVTSGHVTIEIP